MWKNLQGYSCTNRLRSQGVVFEVIHATSPINASLGEGYCACKCSDLLCCSILEGKTYKVPFSYQVSRVRVQICIVLPVRKQNTFQSRVARWSGGLSCRLSEKAAGPPAGLRLFSVEFACSPCVYFFFFFPRYSGFFTQTKQTLG